MAPIEALLVGDDVFPWHDLRERGPEIEAALGDGAAVTATTDRRRMLELPEYDVYVDYTSDNEYADDELDAVLSFVDDGGGYVGIHCAADLTSRHDGAGGNEPSDEPLAPMRELLGGHFLGHPEQVTFGVEVRRDHPVTDGVADFEVYDEPYRLEVDEDAVTVLARMDHPDEDLADTPVAWVREYGDGRVCYCSLGHTTDSLAHPEHRGLLRNGLRWVAGR